MFCKFCGSTLDDNALFCEKCGKKVIREENTNTPSTENSAHPAGNTGNLFQTPASATYGYCCPECGNEQLQIINGMNVTTTTSNNSFICEKCGCKFRNPKDLIQEAKQGKKILATISGIGAVFATIVLIIFISRGYYKPEYPMGGQIGLIISVLLAFLIIGFFVSLSKTSGREKKQEKQLKKCSASIHLLLIRSQQTLSMK